MLNRRKNPTLKQILQNKLNNFSRIAVLGVGSELHADDAAGILVAEYINKGVGKTGKLDKIAAFIGATAPENLTGEIRKFSPSHILIVDCADFGKEPGEILVFSPEQDSAPSFSTHKMPFKMLSNFIKCSLSCEVLIIGIQPKTLEFAAPPSDVAVKAAKKIAKSILELV